MNNRNICHCNSRHAVFQMFCVASDLPPPQRLLPKTSGASGPALRSWITSDIVRPVHQAVILGELLRHAAIPTHRQDTTSSRKLVWPHTKMLPDKPGTPQKIGLFSWKHGSWCVFGLNFGSFSRIFHFNSIGYPWAIGRKISSGPSYQFTAIYPILDQTGPLSAPMANSGADPS